MTAADAPCLLPTVDSLEDRAAVGFWWQPTSCSLQLLFSAPSDGKSGGRGIIEPGSPYKGISKIRYRKVAVTLQEWSALVSRETTSLGVVDSLSDQREKWSDCGREGARHSFTASVLSHVSGQREQVRRQVATTTITTTLAGQRDRSFPSSPGSLGGGLHIHASTTTSNSIPSNSNSTTLSRGNEGLQHTCSSSHSSKKQNKNSTSSSKSAGSEKNSGTSGGKTFPIFPLQIERYQLTCLQVGNPSKASEKIFSSLCAEKMHMIKRGEKIKITAIIEEEHEVESLVRDNGCECVEPTMENKVHPRHAADASLEEKSLNHKGKGKKTKQKTCGGAQHDDLGGIKGKTDVGSCTAAHAEEAADKGGRMIYFLGEPSLGEGAEVELVVHFTAFVQHPSNGGIFLADTSLLPQGQAGEKGGGVRAVALLTHFEVRLARLAFPCPDHPVYRLWWTLENVQLPDYFACGSETDMEKSNAARNHSLPSSSLVDGIGGEYARGYCSFTFFTNAPCKEKVLLPHQAAVQYRFAACGPLPAYSVAMAAFTHPLAVRWGVVPPLRRPPSPLPPRGSSPPPLPPPSVLLRVLSTVPCDLPHIFTAAKDSIQQLQQMFSSPVPLLVQGVSDVLWEEEAYKGKWMMPTAGAAERHPPHPQTQPQQTGQEEQEGGELSSAYSSMLTVLVAPTMPYIGGMEHHGLICLKDTLYHKPPTPFSSSSSSREGSAAQTRKEQDQLILHELAHHWLGNTIGMPFSLKEGLCQWLEVYGCCGGGPENRVFSSFSTSPSRRNIARTGRKGMEKKCNDPGGQQSLSVVSVGRFAHGVKDEHNSYINVSAAASMAVAKGPATGQEFTLHTYRDALDRIIKWSEIYGADKIYSGLRKLVQMHLAQPMMQAAKEDVRGISRVCGGLFAEEDPFTGSVWPSPVYLSADVVYSFFEKEA